MKLKVAILWAAVLLALSMSASAQSADGQSAEGAASAQSADQKQAPTADQKPADSSTGKDSSAEKKSADKKDDAQKDEAKPGVAPVAGDVAAPAKKTDAKTQPCKDDKNAKDKKDKKSDCDDTAVNVDPTKVVEVGSEPVQVKKGSIEDVDAVGNRDIGGRGLGNWYSTNTEINLGRQYAQEIEKSVKLITDPTVQEYVNRIGQNIVKNSDCKVPFTIKIIDTDEINAMALPGGFFYVNSGLILNADEEAELAGVMAHEIAHVCAHHIAREMTRANYAQIGMVPVMIFVGGWTGYGIYEGSQFAIPVTFLKFSREFEAQADYLGVQYMYRAGYDPQAFITFFEKIQALEKRKPGLVSKAFSDHPQTPERILHSQEEIARILPAHEEYTVSTSEFDDVKARLARIENKRRLTDTKGGTKPSLRKPSQGTDTTGTKTGSGSGSGSGSSSGSASSTGSSTGSGSGSGSSSSSGDDRPTLHRRDDDQN